MRRPTQEKRLRAIALGVAAACALYAGSAAAITLEQAYQAALQNDPAYRMKYQEHAFAQEHRVIGRAALLPTISATYSANRNRADVTPHDAAGNDLTTTHPRYTSRSAAVQLRQPLFSVDSYARYRQGASQSRQSTAQFAADTGEVALRVVGAYVDALFASDQLALAQVQRDMYREQQAVNKRLFEKGEGTKTDMLETQARLDIAEASVLEAQDQVAAQRSVLEGVIGQDPGALSTLNAIRFAPLEPKSFEDWKAIALKNNHDLEAARFAVETARLEIVKARGGHAPRLDLVATYSRNDAETLNTFNQDTVNRSVGIQLNIPLYAGGAVNAQSRQAVAGHERAKADLELKTNAMTVELRKAHALVVSSVAKVEALAKAVDSGKQLMRATEQSIKGGVRITLDLLNAQQQLYTSQRDLAQARYGYVLALLRLRAAAGMLAGSDVMEVAAYFR